MRTKIIVTAVFAVVFSALIGFNPPVHQNDQPAPEPEHTASAPKEDVVDYIENQVAEKEFRIFYNDFSLVVTIQDGTEVIREPIDISTLPKDARQKLIDGIKIKGADNMIKLVEDYIS